MIQYQTWNIPILVLFSEIDNISKGEDVKLKQLLGAQGQPHATIKEEKILEGVSCGMWDTPSVFCPFLTPKRLTICLIIKRLWVSYPSVF
jgi:hypothetical protein